MVSLTEKKILYKRNVREKWDLFNYECEEKREDVKKYGPLVKRLARGIRVNLGVGGVHTCKN